MPAIQFFEEDISYKLKNKTLVRQWIKDTIAAEGFKLKELTYVFLFRRISAPYEPAVS